MTKKETLEYYIKEVKKSSYYEFSRGFGSEARSVENRIIRLRGRARNGRDKFSDLVLGKLCDQIGVAWWEIEREVHEHKMAKRKKLALLKEKEELEKRIEKINI